MSTQPRDSKGRFTSATQDNFTQLAAAIRNQITGAGGVYRTGAWLGQNQQLLNTLYRESWIVAAIVDSIAEDMTAAGITLKVDTDSTLAGMRASILEQHATLQRYMTSMGVWDCLTDVLRWARLYGGALAYINIDGQDPTTPLDPDTVAANQFLGLVVYDRYRAAPSLTGSNIMSGGEPEFYRIGEGAQFMAHKSRVLKFIGTKLPRQLTEQNNFWGDSILQRVLQRITLRDNALFSAGRLVNKCFLRTVKVDNLRRIMANGGQAQANLQKMFTLMRDIQDSAGLTIMDTADEFQTDSFTFSGLSELLSAFDSDVSGACGIPMTRLYGQSATGFSTGDADLQTYYDKVASLQESMLRAPLTTLLRVCWGSCFGALPSGALDFEFNNLWRPKDIEDRAATVQEIAAIVNAANAGIVPADKAMASLRAAGGPKDLFASITDADIDSAASVEAPPSVEELSLDAELMGAQDNLDAELMGTSKGA